MIRFPNGLAALFGRLTDPGDRQTYAALISFVDGLPENDELFHIVELLGLLSLVGQRVPDALAEFLAELRAQTKAAAEYHGQVDARLAILPQEIAAGVDPGAIAKAMSEAFRQQLSDTALHDTAALLKLAISRIEALAGEVSGVVIPATTECRRMAATLGAETTKLAVAAKGVKEENVRLMVRQRSSHSVILGLAGLLLFMLGGLCGILLEKRETNELLAEMGARVERIQRPAVPASKIAKKIRRGNEE